MSRPVIVLGSICAILLVAVFLMAIRTQQPERKEGVLRATGSGSSGGLENLTQEMQLVQKRLLAMSDRINSLQNKMSEYPDSTSVLVGTAQQEPTEEERFEDGRGHSQEAGQEDKEQGILTELESYFSSEQEDPVWSDETEDKANASFSSPLLQGSVLDSVECRSTMCRAEILHNSSKDRDKFSLHALKMEPWNTNGHAHVVETDDGKGVRTVLFFAREGTDLGRIYKLASKGDGSE